MSQPFLTRFGHSGKFALALALVLSVIPARAEMKPWEINMDRVKVADPKGLAAKTYFVPSANLVVSCYGSVWAQSRPAAPTRRPTASST